MRKMSFCFFVTVSVLAATLFTGHPAIASEEALTLGMIDPSPSKIIKRFTPLIEYLNRKGVTADKVVVTKTLDEMVEKFKSGEVDFMFESVYSALKMMDETGAVPVLIREKSSVQIYNSVIFVKKDSPIQTLEDLEGKVIAFEDPSSTSSFMLPRGILENAGLKLKESRKPVPGHVAYYFSKDDDNTIAQVNLGRRADAGGIKKSEVEGNPDFRLLSPESVNVPRHVLIVRKGVPYDSLKEILLEMENDPDGQEVLAAINTKTGFSLFEKDPVEFMNTDMRKAMGL